MSLRTENLKAVNMSGLEIVKYLKNSISFDRYNIEGKGRFREFSLAEELSNSELEYGIRFINRWRRMFGGKVVFMDSHRNMYHSFYSPYDNAKEVTFEVINPYPFDNSKIKQIFLHIELFDLIGVIDEKIENGDCMCCVCNESQSDKYHRIQIGRRYEALCERCNSLSGGYRDFATMRRLEYVITNNAKVSLDELIEEKQREACIRSVNNFCEKWNIGRRAAYNFIKKHNIYKHDGKISAGDFLFMHKHFKYRKKLNK